jgi:branched-chain amino acid transport system ATP-binding protein
MKIESLEAGYGDVQILWGVSLEVYSGEITAVIGSNGAGKSTLMRTISGLIPSSGGTITFEGKTISGLTPKAVLAE